MFVLYLSFVCLVVCLIVYLYYIETNGSFSCRYGSSNLSANPGTVLVESFIHFCSLDLTAPFTRLEINTSKKLSQRNQLNAFLLMSDPSLGTNRKAVLAALNLNLAFEIRRAKNISKCFWLLVM